MKKTLILLLLSIGFTACNEKQDSAKGAIYTQVFSADNLSKIAVMAENDKSISNEDVKLLISGLNYYGQHKDSLFGKSVEQIINSEREREKKISIEILKSNTSKMEMNANAYVQITGMNDTLLNEKTQFDFALNFGNMSKKDIKRLEGAIEISDYSNSLLGRFQIVFDANLAAGKEIKGSYKFDYNAANARDMFIRDNFDKLIKIWRPSKIIFADGTELVAKSE